MERYEAPRCINSTPKTHVCNTKDHKKALTVKKLDQALADYSPKDANWDGERAITQLMSDFLFEMERYERWAERMDGCTRTLRFGELINMETGEINPKLVNAFFCHCRHCRICDGRKALVRMGRFKDELPKIEAEHPKARWILLTLTVPNPPVNELRATLGAMNKAWQRFIKRKAFKPVLGWIRATEVTQDKKRPDYAHPHFHVLLLVKPSYFRGQSYVSQAEWLQLWRDCYRDQSITQVDVRAVKGGAMRGAVETLKAFNYSMKVDDLINRTPEWILEYMEQVNHLRFMAAGGVLKDALKKIEEEVGTNEMLLMDDEKGGEVTKIVATSTWRPGERKYRMKTNG